MSMWEKIKPTLVLTLITVIVAALLIVTYNLTYKDTSGEITEKLKTALDASLGGDDYKIVTDWKEAGLGIEKPTEKVDKMTVVNLITNSENEAAIEIIGSGYATDGLDLLVALNKDGTVRGISVISIAETPGLGTKVQNSDFLEQYIGKSGDFSVVKRAATSDNEIEAVTSATYSSKGVTKIVNYAVSLYNQIKGTEASD